MFAEGVGYADKVSEDVSNARIAYLRRPIICLPLTSCFFNYEVSNVFPMKASELKDKSPVEELTLTISALGDARDTSYGRVQSATASDDSATVQLSLWNEQIGKFNVNDKVVIKKGWSKEYKGQMQVSAGKFGTIEKA